MRKLRGIRTKKPVPSVKLGANLKGIKKLHSTEIGGAKALHHLLTVMNANKAVSPSDKLLVEQKLNEALERLMLGRRFDFQRNKIGETIKVVHRRIEKALYRGNYGQIPDEMLALWKYAKREQLEGEIADYFFAKCAPFLEKGIGKVDDVVSKSEIAELALKALQKARGLYVITAEWARYEDEVSFDFQRINYIIRQLGRKG